MYAEEALKLKFMPCKECQVKRPDELLCAACFHNNTLITKLQELRSLWVRELGDKNPLLNANLEEKRIIICSLAGFELDKAERKFIKPLYLRLLAAEGCKLSDSGKELAYGGSDVG